MKTAPQSPALFLDVDDERLWRHRQEIPLTPKTFALLRYLVENRNRLVTKQALLEGVWPGIYVVESEVKHYVGELRKALGDDPKAPQFIETIRGRGYRFIGEITVRDSRSGSKTTAIASVRTRIEGRSVGTSRITLVSISRIFCRIFVPFPRRGGTLKIIAAIEYSP
jgi:DNA-binding winged helix-turn-helix (wHTH) protein